MEIELEIGGRSYAMACRDGEEARFGRLASIIDEKMKQATGAVGGLNEVRQFLFASLLLADELEDARKAASGSRPTSRPDTPSRVTDPAAIEAIERIADQLEAFADRADGGVEGARTAS